MELVTETQDDWDETGNESEGPVLQVPMDALAVAMVERFMQAFPRATYQALEAFLAGRCDWALGLPALQARMAELVAANSGQLPA